MFIDRDITRRGFIRTSMGLATTIAAVACTPQAQTENNQSPPKKDKEELLRDEIKILGIEFNQNELNLWSQDTPFNAVTNEPKDLLLAGQSRLNLIISKMSRSSDSIFQKASSFLRQNASGTNRKIQLTFTMPGETFANKNASFLSKVDRFSENEVFYELSVVLDDLAETAELPDLDVAIALVHEAKHIEDLMEFEKEGKEKNLRGAPLADFTSNRGYRQTFKDFEGSGYLEGTRAYIYLVGQTHLRKRNSFYEDLLEAYLQSNGDTKNPLWQSAVERRLN